MLMVGDVHGRFYKLREIIEQSGEFVTVQVGDFGYYPKYPDVWGEVKELSGKRIYFVDGNHEDHEEILALYGESDKCGVVFEDRTDGFVVHMQRGSLYTIQGKMVLAIGGAASIDQRYRTPGLDWFSQEIPRYEDIDWKLLSNHKVDIVVSHTCPQEFLPELQEKKRIRLDNDPTRKLLSEVLRRVKPERWVFGHWHLRASGVYRGCRWDCLDAVDCGNFDNCSLVI